MAEYITKEQAYNAVVERINELKADRAFNITHEICINGVNKHIEIIPKADVVERDKIQKAREEIDDLDRYFDNDLYTDNTDAMFKCKEVLEILDKLIVESEDK